MKDNTKDTNIVSADELSFLQSIGMNVPTSKELEQNTETDLDTTQEENHNQTQQNNPNTENESDDILDIINDAPKTVVKDIRKSIDLLIENESWKDVSLKYQDKEYESISDLLNEVEADDDLFTSLTKLQNDLKQEEINSNYIKVADTDETRAKLAKAIVAGVDYTDLLQHQEDFINPISQLDFNNRDVLLDFVRYGLKEIEGIPERYHDIEINDLSNKFELLEKAEQYRAYINKNFQEEIELRTSQELERKEVAERERRESIKNLRKDLRESNFAPTFVEKAVQLRYSVDEEGQEHYISLLKNRIENDKNFERNVIHMLLDENDFYSKIKAPVKQEQTKKVLELVNVIPNKTGKSVVNSNSKSINEADADFISLLQNK